MFAGAIIWVESCPLLARDKRSLEFTVIRYTAHYAAAQCIVIGPVCRFVCVCAFVGVFVCLWVCYHDNSKLHASILTKLGL